MIRVLSVVVTRPGAIEMAPDGNGRAAQSMVRSLFGFDKQV